MPTFSVKNFERFQHYKDRSPPWIKLYNELLDDYGFGRLPDASKMHLVAIWLLASRNDNKIPHDAEWVGRRINATSKVDLALLEREGFIIINHDCSNPLAARKQDAMPERETEAERETEGEKKETPSAGADAPPLTAQSFESLFWATARRTLVTKGAAKDEKRAGGLIGKWLAAIGPPDSKAILLRLLASAEANCQGDFTAYITQAIKDRNKASGKPSQDQLLKSGLARAVAERAGGSAEGDYPGEPEGNRGEGRGYVRTVDLTGELGPDGEVLFGSPGGAAFGPSGRGAETGADEL